MDMLERLKLNGELSKAIKARNAEQDVLKRLPLIKKVQELREKLGLIKGKEEGEIDITQLTPLELPENADHKALELAVKNWLKENLQGKKLKTSDSRFVFFNSTRSTKHLTFNGRKSVLMAKAVTRVAEVFAEGKALPFEELKHQNADFIGFRKYQKWVEIDNLRLLLEAAAGEREDGKLFTDGKLIAYNQKIVEKIANSSPPELSPTHLDRYIPTPSGSEDYATNNQATLNGDIIQDSATFDENDTSTSTDTSRNKNTAIQSLQSLEDENVQAGSSKNSGTALDNISSADDSQESPAILTILSITDLDGNPVYLDQENTDENEIDVNQFNTDFSAYQTPEDTDFTQPVRKILKTLQGKYVNTVIGKVLFNAKSSDKLAYNTKKNEIRAKLVPFVPQTLSSGKYLGKDELYKQRKDNFIAFHKFQGEVILDGLKVTHIVKVGERDSGEYEFIAYYNNYDRDGSNHNSGSQPSQPIQANSPAERGGDLHNSVAFLPQSEQDNLPVELDTTLVMDNMQAENGEWGIEIISITDLDGNPITFEEEDVAPSSTNNDKAVIRQAYAFDENKTPNQRQKDNNAVFALLDQIEQGEIKPEALTLEQKAVLAKYSGSGGGLTSKNNKNGSPHEYYTPAPVAEAMWQAVQDMGFTGGKVLDPCGGSGIFGAFAPENSIVQVIEMDKISAKVNQLVNGSEHYHVDVGSFEEKVNYIPDHSIDAIVTNVPFGGSDLRTHRHEDKDQKYLSHNLHTYFVLRSLDKLKYGGLAAFIVPTSFLDSKARKAIDARIITSNMAEFIGAYRLPNSVFGTASADVATDVIFFRKYSQAMIEKIAELSAQNPTLLTEANVLWDIYTGGNYFKQAEHKKFIFGEEGTVESWRTDKNGKKKQVYAVLNNDSVTNIAKAIQRFEGSRIDWALLDEVETAVQSYQQGDIIYQNGQAYQFNGVTFDAVEIAENQAGKMADEIMATLANPLMAFEQKVKAQSILQACQYYMKTAQHSQIVDWVKPLAEGLSTIPEDKQAQQCRLVLTGLAVQYVMDNFSGENQLEQHQALSEAMKGRVTLDPKLSRYKKAVEAIKLHYQRKTGYSAAWRGEVAEIEQQLSQAKQIEQIQYLNGTLALSTEKVKALGIDPLTNDDWCINADGTEATKADDYFVGNLKEVLNKIDQDLEKATDEAIKIKLVQMREKALALAPAVNVNNMRFTLRSPFVPPELVLRFVQAKIAKMSSAGETGSNRGIKRMSARLESENGRMYVSIDGNHKDNNDMLLKRIGAYLKNGTISHGGIGLTTEMEDNPYRQREMTDAEKLQLIRKTVTDWNAEFDTWLKADPQFMSELEAKAKDPQNIQFPKTDDESEIAIAGANAEIKLHGYQNAYIRKSAREFSGINSFGIGLGKTFTGLAAAQYALETGTKKKVCFIVPNAVLSNWHKESHKYYNETEKARCLFIGADTDKKGDFVVNSQNYARDLNVVMENRHNKIFMTQQAFEKIRLREETAQSYVDYMKQMDSSFAESQNATKDEKAQKKAADLVADIAGKNKLENAPFFEELGIDAIIIDEAHHFKNAKQAFRTAQVKGLPTGSPSNRAIDMNVKSWYLRGQNVRKDGVMLLTATPVTNSPLEIYSMMSLAVGEERVKNAFLGNINGADDFIEAICEIQDREEANIANETMAIQTLTGIKNLDLVQNLIQTNADVKEAKDVGIAFKQVESETVATNIQLDKATKRELDKYKNAYRIARQKLNNRYHGGESQQAEQDYQMVLAEAGSIEKVGHPFSMVNRMSKALLDTELNTGQSFYQVENINGAQKAVDAFNNGKKSFTFETTEKPENEDLIVKSVKRVSGDRIEHLYVVKAVATLSGKKVILSCNEFEAQLRLEALLDQEQAEVSVSISPKVARLVENVKKEQAYIRYQPANSPKPTFAKQIIFVESLAMHTKIKRILAKEAGIPAERITFISGKFNSDPDEIIEVQESFNADGEANKYSLIIANKKAEVGINLQKGCQAIHHLELNWTPDSITQRNGRGVRQGNLADSVNIYFYEADGTFDSYKRTAIDRKSNWIDSVMSQSNNTQGFAEVGQGLTEQDYDEMINFDGSAAQFNEILQRQADRKQAEIDRNNRQAQQVNIQIMKDVNQWLRNNATVESAIIQALKQVNEKNDALKNLKEKWQKAEEKGAKTAERNRKEYEKAYQELEKLLPHFEGIMTQNGTPAFYKITEEGRNKYSYYSRYADFSVSTSYLVKDTLTETIPAVQAYQQTYIQQQNLRRSAAMNARQMVNTPNAVPAFAVEALSSDSSVIEYNGKWYPTNTIVIKNEDQCYLLLNQEHIYGCWKASYNVYSTIGYAFSNSEGTQILTPDDPNYIEGLKQLAEVESKMVMKELDYNPDWQGEGIYVPKPSSYYGSKFEPALSMVLDNIVDFLALEVQTVREKILGHH